MRVRLRQLRKACGYTQQTFAEATGMSRNHYSQIESGEKNPSLKRALKIKEVLNYMNDDLFENTTLERRAL